MRPRYLPSLKFLMLKQIITRNRQRRKRMLLALKMLLERRRLLCLCLLSVVRYMEERTINVSTRSCRRLQRNNGWWEVVWTAYSDARFKRTFRISRETFTFILGKIGHMLEYEPLNELPISPGQRLAICLYRLGRGDYYYTIAEMTGLGKSTVCSIVAEVSKVIVECLWDLFVSRFMPVTSEDLQRKTEEMNNLWQFPCAWAAVDGCHIPIKCPPGGPEACKEYHNFKNFYSIILMSMVDARYRFVWASCGFPGNSHDSIILQSTHLWDKISNEDFIPRWTVDIDSLPVQAVILGDSAFPLRTWLLKPYTNALLTEQQKYFNYRLSRARMVVEGAYGQLKGRWRVLLRKCESTVSEMKITTLACVILHNMCIERNDIITNGLEVTGDNQTRGTESEVQNTILMTQQRKVKDKQQEADKIRNKLVTMFWNEKQQSCHSNN